jgi:hypothetical protein
MCVCVCVCVCVCPQYSLRCLEIPIEMSHTCSVACIWVMWRGASLVVARNVFTVEVLIMVPRSKRISGWLAGWRPSVTFALR